MKIPIYTIIVIHIICMLFTPLTFDSKENKYSFWTWFLELPIRIFTIYVFLNYLEGLK